MKPLVSLASERFRTTFLVFYALSSIVPILVMLYVLYQYIWPGLTSRQLESMSTPLAVGLLVMIVTPALGVVMMSWWIRSLENLTRNIRSRTSTLLNGEIEITETNEILAIEKHLDGLYGELQAKIDQMNQYGHELEESKKRLSQMAASDQLTGLYNRRQFEPRLTFEVKRAEKERKELALIMIDVDGFRKYNETYGHRAGDKLLRDMGLLIRDQIRRFDSAFRYGGDEFAVLLPNCGVEEAAAVAQKLVDATSLLTFKTGTARVEKLSISCGVVAYKRGLRDFAAQADRCLAQAKAAGRGRVVMVAPEDAAENDS